MKKSNLTSLLTAAFSFVALEAAQATDTTTTPTQVPAEKSMEMPGSGCAVPNVQKKQGVSSAPAISAPISAAPAAPASTATVQGTPASTPTVSGSAPFTASPASPASTATVQGVPTSTPTVSGSASGAVAPFGEVTVPQN